MSTKVRGAGPSFDLGSHQHIYVSPYPEDDLIPRAGTFGHAGTLGEVDHILLLEGLNRPTRTGGTRLRTIAADAQSLIDTRAEMTGGKREVARDRFTDGNYLAVGPYLKIPESALKDGYQVHVWASQILESNTAYQIVGWACGAIKHFTEQHSFFSSYMKMSTDWKAGPGSATAPLAKNGKSLWANSSVYYGALMGVKNPTGEKQLLYPKFDQGEGDVTINGNWISAGGAPGTVRGVGCVVVPDNQVWATSAFTGKTPIAKFEHPKTKKKWLVFCEITARQVFFTFKEYKPGFWEKIWNFIKDVVCMIIDGVKALFGLLMAGACAYAKAKLNEISKMAAEEGTPSAAKLELVAKGTGVPAEAIKKVINGTEGAVVHKLGDDIINNICGKPKPGKTPAIENPFGMSLAVKIALGGAAMVGVYFLAR